MFVGFNALMEETVFSKWKQNEDAGSFAWCAQATAVLTLSWFSSRCWNTVGPEQNASSCCIFKLLSRIPPWERTAYKVGATLTLGEGCQFTIEEPDAVGVCCSFLSFSVFFSL